MSTTCHSFISSRICTAILLLLVVIFSEFAPFCKCMPPIDDNFKSKVKSDQTKTSNNLEQCKMKGWVPVQKFKRKVQSNGCSKPEFLTVEGEEDFTTCCDHHDACYATCGISKDYCEKEFEKCMKRLCKEAFSSNDRCEGAASTYAMGTAMFGDAGFQVNK